jgi:hypothetical protein
MVAAAWNLAIGICEFSAAWYRIVKSATLSEFVITQNMFVACWSQLLQETAMRDANSNTNQEHKIKSWDFEWSLYISRQ